MDLKIEVVKFMQTHKAPVNDEEFHALAGKLGVEPDKLESIAYGLLTSFFNSGNAKKKKLNIKDIDEAELRKGIKVEMEHTNEPIIAARVALDHLAETPKYYSILLKAGL